MRGRGFVAGQSVINDGSGSLDLVPVVADDGSGDIALITQYTDSDRHGAAGAAGSQRGLPAGLQQRQPTGILEDVRVRRGHRRQPQHVGVVPGSGRGQHPDPDHRHRRRWKTPVAPILEKEVCTATTVGADNKPPDVLGFVSGNIEVTPGNGETGVDPTTPILVRFNKPVQPTDVGTFFDKTNLVPTGGGVTLNVTIAANTFDVIYYADPLTSGDFCNYRVVPAYNLPGSAATQPKSDRDPGRDQQHSDPRPDDGVPRPDCEARISSPAKGPGIVNAPVAPDALFVGMVGAVGQASRSST